MSDTTFRRQQEASRSQQFYDAQRYQSDQQAVDTLGNVGQQFVQQQRDQVLLGMEQQKMQQEMAMQQADLGMRHALFQQEQQQNALKLQMLSAINQADMGKEQLRAAKLQNNAMEFELEQKQKAAQPKEEFQAKFQNMLRAGGGIDNFLRAGFIPTDESMMGFRKDPDAAAKMLESWRSQRGSGDVTEFNAQRNYLSGLADNYDLPEAARAEARSKLLKLDPDLAKFAGAPAKQAPKADPKAIADTAQSIHTGIGDTANPMNAVGNQLMPWGDSLKQADTEAISKFLWANAEAMAREQQSGFDADPERKGLKATPQTGVKFIVDILNNPNDPRRAEILRRLRERGVIQ